MSNAAVTLECRILGDSPMVKQQFLHHTWENKRCAHDISDRIFVVVSSDQWTHVVSKVDEFIAVDATMDANGFLTLLTNGGVVPFHKHSLQLSDPSEIRAIEFFAGGYSGWTHACRTLSQIGIPIAVKFALDSDPECARCYCYTHHIDKVLFGPSPVLGSEEMHEKLFICDDINHLAWLHTTGSDRFHVAMISPPCPPWSKAAGEQGLQSHDGLLTLQVWSVLSLLRIPVNCMEMVAAMLEHAHWPIVRQYIQWCGYRVMWVKDMPLQEMIPQSRNRMLLVAVLSGEPLHPHRCTEWYQKERPTLKSYQAIFTLTRMWLDHAIPEPEVLDMYLDPAYLPGNKGHFGVVTKKCKRDIEHFRIRLPENVITCIMACYSFSHLLPKHVLEKKGLYGSLLLSEQGLRFLALPELLVLFGTTNSAFLPKDIRKATHIVGNCIAVPHAALVVTNALAFILSNFTQIEVKDLVHKVHLHRLHSDNMIIDENEDGFFFSRRIDIGLSPTQPIHSFHRIVISSPLEEFQVICEQGVVIHELLQILNGQSFPAELAVVFDHQPTCRVRLPLNMKMFASDIHIQANVPSVLMINEEHIVNGGSSVGCIVILFPDKVMAFKKSTAMTVDQIQDLVDKQLEREETCVLLSMMGQELNGLDCSPTCMFALPSLPKWSDFTVLKMITIEPTKQMIRFSGSDQALKETMEVFRQTGTTHMLHALGWHFVAAFDASGNVMMNCVYLVRKALTFNATVPDLTMFIISRFFILRVNQHDLYPPSDDGEVSVRLKLWNTWIWKGTIPVHRSLVPIENAWIELALCFRCKLCIRFVVQGRNINPEAALSSYVHVNETLQIFTTMSLHGGAGNPDDRIEISSVEQRSTSEHTDASDSRTQLARMESFNFDQTIAAIVSHWVDLPGQVEPFPLDDVQTLRYYEEDGMICYDGNMRSVMAFLQLMQNLQVVKVIEALGWIVAVQFISSHSPVVTRLTIFPRPAVEVVTVKIIQSFLHVGFFFAALPAPIVEIAHGVKIRIKVWGVIVFHDWLSQQCPVQAILDAWNTACHMVNVPIPIRIVCRGRRMNPDRTLGDYMHQRDDGTFYANLHLVVALHGGGNPKDFAITQKNALATFLLAGGGDLSEVTTFVESILKAAGPQTIASILSLKSKAAKWEGIRKLANTLKIMMPNFTKKQVEQKNAVETRFRKEAAALWEDPHLTEIAIKEDFFRNEDDSVTPQIHAMAPSTTGVCLLKANEADEWLRKTGPLSQDELAIVVIGPCPCTDTAKCHRLQFPAYDASQQPIVMNGCMHNVGRKQIKIGLSNNAQIKIDDTMVVSWTIFRDEVGDDNWNIIMQAPVKKTLEMALGSNPEITFIGPPWGRSFQHDRKRCEPADASSMQFHSRINQNHLQKLLRISGINGIYTTPKTETKQISNAYQIVWVQMSSVDLIVTASTFANHCGIVRNSKYEGKITKGIRFLKEDFEAAFKQLKPEADVPSLVTPNFMYKITPVPLGATFDHIQKWLDSQKWKAKPLRSLSSQVWLITADAKIEDEFAHWNGETLLIKPLVPRQARPPVIVAGLNRQKLD